VNYETWVSEFGFPVGVILFGAYCSTRVARFFAPIIRRVTENHCDLIETLKEQSIQQTDILKSQSLVMEQNSQVLLQISRTIHRDADRDDDDAPESLEV